MGMGTGWGLVTLAQPAPVMQAQWVLYMNATCSMGIWCCLANIEQWCRWQTILLYSTCGVDPQKKKRLHHKNISTSNGNPEVEQKRKKLEAKKQSMKPAPTQKHPSTQAPAKTKTMTNTAVKPAQWPWHPSVKIEEIEDESDYCTSVPPCNPQHILEAADGSDDDVNTPAPPRKSTKKPVITKWHPSVEIKEVFYDESDHHTSVPPHNPQHILEAANGSDDGKEDPIPNGNKEGDMLEESDKAELGM